MFVRRSLDNIDSEDLESFEYRGNGRNITNVINSQFDMSNFSFNGVSVSPSYSYRYTFSQACQYVCYFFVHCRVVLVLIRLAQEFHLLLKFLNILELTQVEARVDGLQVGNWGGPYGALLSSLSVDSSVYV